MNCGVSIIICCFNSESRIEPTLKHLLGQITSNEIRWELILVDNNSQDQTVEVAQSILDQYINSLTYKIIHQPIQGLSAARKMGIENSSFDYMLFCDDDNWLAPNYIQLAHDFMEQNPNIGVLGGNGEAISDMEIPSWFEEIQEGYAVGPQAENTQDVTDSSGCVYGAGMVIRKTALAQLEKAGFKSLLSDRKGKSLSSGGDSELCMAIALKGYRIWYHEGLQFKHYIPQNRLNKEYIEKLFTGFGKSQSVISLYQFALKNPNIQHKSWIWLKEILNLLKKQPVLLFPKTEKQLGKQLFLRLQRAYLFELLHLRGRYDLNLKKILTLKERLESQK